MRAFCKAATAFCLTLATGWCAAAEQETPAAPASAPTAREHVIRDVLVVGSVGAWGRTPTHTDAIEAQLVTGTWTPPAAGTVVKLPDGKERTWAAFSAEADGFFRHEALERGYAYAAFESDRAQIMLLDAAGHSMVYVNGTPRVGDPYQTGYVRLPVPLKAGTNHLLFACGRGELRAKLVECSTPIALDIADATLPDLIIGEKTDVWAAVVVRNATAQTLRNTALIARCGETQEATPLPPIPAYSVRKVGFHILGEQAMDLGEQDISLRLLQSDNELDRTEIKLQVRPFNSLHRRTFLSDIDGSVQFYAVQPGDLEGESRGRLIPGRPALFLSLHGAGVDAERQASCYARKDWGHVVAPTNRRPYGFDWEDWGRIDALEVLAIAEQSLCTDPGQTYLTGHSMGGHGTWQLGAHYPDRFAAIAPSAGWISFFTYAGGQRPEPKSPIEELLLRAATPIDTLALKRNYLHFGIYVLHGDADDNVPVEQARTMRRELGKYHPNFAYYERPGAGHWWGNECMDWPPLFEFLHQNVKTPTDKVRRIEFITANPAISATCHWATIETQSQSLALSKIDLQLDPNARVISGGTENVARLTLALQPQTTPVPPREGAGGGFILEPNHPMTIDLDGDHLENIPWPADHRLHLARAGQDAHWQILPVDPDEAAGHSTGWSKNPLRAGPFKEAFQHRMQFVYGTKGALEENAAAAAKAHYDAEMFWYRGNASIDVLPDTEFDPLAEPDRGVVLYGHGDMHGAWEKLFKSSPVQVKRGVVRVGDRELKSDDLAVLAAYPRPGSKQAMVAIVAGTGPAGLRLTERMPYFMAGVAYPDWIVFGPDTLQTGPTGIRAAGFYNADWQYDPTQSALREP